MNASQLLLQSAGLAASNLPAGASALTASFTLQGPTGASLTAQLECSVLGKLITLSPVLLRTASVAITPTSLPSPMAFIPSEPGSPWLLRPAVAVRAGPDGGWSLAVDGVGPRRIVVEGDVFGYPGGGVAGRAGEGWRVDWTAPDGARQSTWLPDV